MGSAVKALSLRWRTLRANIYAILQNSTWYEWSLQSAEKLDSEHSFTINPIIYAECSIGFDSIEKLEDTLSFLQLGMTEIPREALFLAGKAFVSYKKRHGGKSNVLPDFFIGAHAAINDYMLLTRDKGRFTTYFPTVKLICPVQ